MKKHIFGKVTDTHQKGRWCNMGLPGPQIGGISLMIHTLIIIISKISKKLPKLPWISYKVTES